MVAGNCNRWSEIFTIICMFVESCHEFLGMAQVWVRRRIRIQWPTPKQNFMVLIHHRLCVCSNWSIICPCLCFSILKIPMEVSWNRNVVSVTAHNEWYHWLACWPVCTRGWRFVFKPSAYTPDYKVVWYTAQKLALHRTIWPCCIDGQY